MLLVRRHFKIIFFKNTIPHPKIISFDTTHPLKIISERLITNYLETVSLLLKTVPLPQKKLELFRGGGRWLWMIEKTEGPPQNHNQQHPMPTDAAWQGSRKSVEKKQRWWHHKSNKLSLNRPPFTPDNDFGGGSTSRPPQETN